MSAARAALAGRIVNGLRAFNHGIALLLGAVLLLTVLYVVIDVVMRKAGHALGGSDEYSGYVMAALASWGMGWALMERAHVRIDLLRQAVAAPARRVLDLFALLALNVVVCVVAWRAWPVLSKTLERGSRANTPLETPLWIPQGIWFSGWLWFALSSLLLALCAVVLLLRGEHEHLESAIGLETEMRDHDQQRS